MNIEDAKRKIIPVLNKHNVTKASLFGSYARGDANQDSDIDILIELDKDKSLLDFIGIKLELEEITKKKVDLVEFDTIKPALKETILKDQIAII